MPGAYAWVYVTAFEDGGIEHLRLRCAAVAGLGARRLGLGRAPVACGGRRGEHRSVAAGRRHGVPLVQLPAPHLDLRRSREGWTLL